MTFDIRMIINTITLGIITLIFGLHEKKTWKVIVGGLFASAGIILNTISALSGG